MQTPKRQDPTRKEIDNFIKSRPGLTEFDKTTIEAAIYWFASNCHTGKASNLYSVLSTSEYSPGYFEVGPEESGVWYVYDILIKRFYP